MIGGPAHDTLSFHTAIWDAMRWALILIGGIIGAGLLLTLLPHRRQAVVAERLISPRAELALPPHAPPGPAPHLIEPPKTSVPPAPAPAVPAVTSTIKFGVVGLGLLLLFFFRGSEKVQTAALMLITSGALALLGQSIPPSP